MKVNVIMFSPAGGTAKTAEILARELGTLSGAVDIAEPDVFYGGIKADPEAIAIVAMPCYGGRVPQLAAERFRQVDGSGAKTLSFTAASANPLAGTTTSRTRVKFPSAPSAHAAIASACRHAFTSGVRQNDTNRA